MTNNLLAGKRGIIFGALDENSIAWKVAQKAHEQGAMFTLTNAPVALRMGEINKLANACNTIVIPADATLVEDLEKLIQQSVEHLGGKLDFVLHSIGMSPNVRKGKVYTDVNYDWMMKNARHISHILSQAIANLYKARCFKTNGPAWLHLHI
jgi:enoyl-[acyl-carrier protein] reductase I